MSRDKSSFAFGGIPRSHLYGGRLRSLPPNAERDYYSVAQAAAVLNVCTRTMRRLIGGKAVACKRVGRYVLVPKRSVDALVK